ncbi:hypothetical protein NARC_10437 [Candidatus Nitrosocosmicus arcticus]|uniref:Uncharacterized protein n=1 Tax=Candidatus Nitrosocosmicus arcticus TaxID=2035267 RepID=A0A557SZK1_9ARCH|nr:hypothetical protein NARC_10437 [Candidatus Nitrosocosmicus arcticus]
MDWDGIIIPKVCKLLKLEHRTHPSYEKSIIEGTVQQVKVRMGCLIITFLVSQRIAN